MINIPLCSDPEDNTWDTVDGKLAEAELFLRHMADAVSDMFEFGCYLSAYLSAARTATLALQRFSHIPGFAAWYEPQRERLKADASANSCSKPVTSTFTAGRIRSRAECSTKAGPHIVSPSRHGQAGFLPAT